MTRYSTVGVGAGAKVLNPPKPVALQLENVPMIGMIYS
jgi:hypothetical protein